MTKVEAAESLGMSVDSLERHVLHELRVVRVGTRIVIPVKELERWVDRNAAKPIEAELEELRR